MGAQVGWTVDDRVGAKFQGRVLRELGITGEGEGTSVAEKMYRWRGR